MSRRKLQTLFPVVAGIMLLSACGQNAETDVASEAASAQLPNGMTVKEQIEARQGHLKKIGKAFKAISDQLKAGSPDLAEIQTAAASVPQEAMGMADWFPEGTGPESGVKTGALPIIWEDKADFDEKVLAMQDAAGNLASVAQEGDIAAIGAAFKTTGGTCKDCHDKYREDD
tara:strand:+ start:320 stop:835 length:516 start_codon:yes stop_codon:yes gene_type:complete